MVSRISCINSITIYKNQPTPLTSHHFSDGQGGYTWLKLAKCPMWLWRGQKGRFCWVVTRPLHNHSHMANLLLSDAENLRIWESPCYLAVVLLHFVQCAVVCSCYNASTATLNPRENSNSIIFQVALSLLDVSKNRSTPKSSILIGFSIINHPFWVFFPLFLGTPYSTQCSWRMAWMAREDPPGSKIPCALPDPPWLQTTGFLGIHRCATVKLGKKNNSPKR